VEIGEDDLALPDQRVFDGLRLLDMHDHLSPLVDLLRGFDHLRTCVDVSLVVKSAAEPCVLLHQQLMTMSFHDLYPRGRHRDAILLGLDLLENSYDHVNLL
jgi:hypothetical protein